MSDEARRIAAGLRSRGLAVPAGVALEALRPLRSLVAAGAAFGGGFLPLPRAVLEAVQTDAAWDDLASAIESDVDECPISEG